MEATGAHVTAARGRGSEGILRRHRIRLRTRLDVAAYYTLARPVPDDVQFARAARFFGIVIRMFVEAGGQHHRAHFHAYYQEHAAVFAIDTIECLGGSLPKAQQRLVEA